MSVTYNELTKSIDIKDGLKTIFLSKFNDTYVNQCSFEYQWSSAFGCSKRYG
jgi:hypothetical protein